jgi:hypothetical protein
MKPFENEKDLGRVLVLCPYRPSISDPTVAMFDNLTRCGATILKLPGLSDVGLARNLLAAGACEFIGKATRDIDVVMWIDADMYADRPVLLRQLNHLAELDTLFSDLGVPVQPAVSGMYARRRQANVLTASRVASKETRKLHDGTLLVPAHTGLGCFAQSAWDFVKDCEDAEQLTNEQGQTFPELCRTGARDGTLDGEPVRCWGQEDWWYCDRIWQRGDPVYLDTSCAWGHLAESLTLPQGLPDGLLTPEELRALSEEMRALIDSGSSARSP